MTDEHKNAPNELGSLLTLLPEEILRTLPNEMRHSLLPLISALGVLEDKSLSQEEHDEMIKIAQRSANKINKMLSLILEYFGARDDMKNTNNNPAE